MSAEIFVQSTTGTVHTIQTCGVRRGSHAVNIKATDLDEIRDGLQRGALTRCRRCASDLGWYESRDESESETDDDDDAPWPHTAPGAVRRR